MLSTGSRFRGDERALRRLLRPCLPPSHLVASPPNRRRIVWEGAMAALQQRIGRSATACGSTGTCRSRWTTAWCCAPTSFARSKDGQYPVILTYGPYAKGLAFQDGYPSAWQRMAREASRRHRRAPPTSTRTGRWSIRRNGCRTTMSACASTRAAPAARPASSIISRRARPRISTTASNGPACSRGRTARSGSTASPITA